MTPSLETNAISVVMEAIIILLPYFHPYPLLDCFTTLEQSISR